MLNKIDHYTPSKNNDKAIAIINAGTSDDNIKIIKLPDKYTNPKFYPRKFENWPDEFEIQLLDINTIKVRRTDVIVGGWGENLIIDVYHDIGSHKQLPKKLIPNIIYQTFEEYEVPTNMYKAIKSWKDLNPEYEHYYFSNEDRIEFIKKYFTKDTLDAYLTIIPGAYRADLWRCCILYERGGVYVDADTICLKSLKDYIFPNDEFMAARDDPMSKSFISNAFIACIPKHPFMKEQISAIVNNIKMHKKLYHLNISGPGLLGKSINKVCGRNIDSDFQLGENNINNYRFKLFMHDWKTKTIIWNDNPILLTEYNGKAKEMELINNPTYYSLYHQDIIYQVIPREIYYTTKDYFWLNFYMVDSFQRKNKYWKLNYFDDKACLNFIKNNNNIFLEELNVDVLAYYLTLENGGEKSDLWRYCVIYLKGGIYVDSDTYCNIPLDKWIKHHDLVLGIEAFLSFIDAKHFGMHRIGANINSTIISVCNWSFAASPKHIFFKNLIIDICTNPIFNDILNNTGPGRMTKHAINYFSDCNLLLLKSQDIIKGKSILFNINKFGSNQLHSNAFINHSDPLNCKENDVYIIHMFDGSWRYQRNHKDIKIYPSSDVTHNLTITKIENGFKGIARLDKDASRHVFMQKIGDCRYLLEINFDEQLNIISQNERTISNYPQIAKFEDYRYFTFNNNIYLSVSYIDPDFNTRMAILNNGYKYLGDIIIDNYNKVSFTGTKKVWEKNWLFIEKDGILYFIYSTMPRYILYKCTDFEKLLFIKHIDIEWPLDKTIPDEEKYFTSYIGSDIKISVGGSTNPIFIKDKNIYLYLIHTKLNNEFKYNHYAVVLNERLVPIKFCTKPIINKLIPYNLCFVTTMVETEYYLILTGGIADRYNFTWEFSKEIIFKIIGI